MTTSLEKLFTHCQKLEEKTIHSPTGAETFEELFDVVVTRLRHVRFECAVWREIAMKAVEALSKIEKQPPVHPLTKYTFEVSTTTLRELQDLAEQTLTTLGVGE